MDSKIIKLLEERENEMEKSQAENMTKHNMPRFQSEKTQFLFLNHFWHPQ